MSRTVRIATGTLDFARARFLRDDGEVVRLTTREVALLEHLGDNGGADVSRDDLLERVWGHHELSLSRAVDTAVSRLRRKIEADPSDPQVLCTAHGQGYRLVMGGPAAPAPPVPVVTESRELVLGDIEIDLGAGRVNRDGGAFALTAQERRLLITLADRPGRVVDADRLARLAGVEGGRPALSNAIWRLRAKIEIDAADPHWLVSVRGQGYRLDADVRTRRPGLDALSRTLWTVADQAGSLLGLDDCVIYAVDGDHLVQVAAYGYKSPQPGLIRNPLALRVGQGIVGNAARSRAVVCVDDVDSDGRYVEDSQRARSELAVPVLFRDEVVGVLDSESRRVGAYGEQHRRTFEALGCIAAAAVTDARSFIGC